MRPSSYLKVFTVEGNEDRVLLFSTRTCSKTLIKKDTREAMVRSALSPENEIALHKIGMMVTDRDSERSAISNVFESLNRNNTLVDIIVVLNLDCNFACRYCYEGEMKDRIYMGRETASDLIAFIGKILDRDKKALHLDFYGGEPLLSPELIKEISAQLRHLTHQRGASFGFGLVTNGSLFNKRIAEELIRLGLETVKVTLDGPPHIHNLNRPFKSGKGSFDTIVRNIKDTWDLARIAIGGNFEQDNYREFPLLLDHLIHEGITPDRISQVKFDPVMKRPDNFLSPVDLNDGCMSIDEPWVMDALLFLREEILKRGFRTPGVRPAFCSVENNNSYVVNHDGTLYKCPGFLGIKGFEAGDLINGPMDHSLSYRPGIWNNSECINCEYLPLCFGGCRFAKFARDGEIDSPDCRRKYFDTCLERLVKQDIKYGIKAEK